MADEKDSTDDVVDETEDDFSEDADPDMYNVPDEDEGTDEGESGESAASDDTEGSESPAEGAEAEAEGKPEINKEWQQTQQELANARRQMEAEAAEKQQLTERIAALEAKAEGAQGDESESDEFDESEIENDPIGTVKEMRKRLVELEKREQKFQQELERQRQEELARTTAQTEAAAYDRFFKQIHTKFDEGLKNRALEIAREDAKELGFPCIPGKPETHPNLATTIALMKGGYYRADAETKKVRSTNTGTRPPKGDNNKTGGAPATRKVRTGSIDAVVADMRKEGRFKNLLVK